MLRERHVIDLFKGATAPFVLAVMAYTSAWSRYDAWLYLAIHGMYGVLWVTKSRVFGDRQWERPLTPLRAAMLTAGLLGYWVGPVVMLAKPQDAPPWLVGAVVALFGAGVFLHFAADMQKHMAMTLRPGVLLTDGLWARTRNPNYLGELCIYAAFASLSRHPAPFVLFAFVIGVEWVPNMRRKDASLSRYPAFAGWRARTGLILPRILPAPTSTG